MTEYSGAVPRYLEDPGRTTLADRVGRMLHARLVGLDGSDSEQMKWKYATPRIISHGDSESVIIPRDSSRSRREWSHMPVAIVGAPSREFELIKRNQLDTNLLPVAAYKIPMMSKREKPAMMRTVLPNGLGEIDSKDGLLSVYAIGQGPIAFEASPGLLDIEQNILHVPSGLRVVNSLMLAGEVAVQYPHIPSV